MNLKERKQIELDPDYPKKQKALENLLNKIKKTIEPNRSVLLGFHEGYSIKNGNTIGTQIKNLYVLRRITEDFKVCLSKLTSKDLECIRINWAKQKSPHAISRDLRVLKALIKHTNQKKLVSNENLNAPAPYSTIEGKLREEQIPKPEEIAKLFSFLPSKHKAILACLYGGGLRISAARFLKRDNLDWESDGGVSLSFVSKGSINKVWIRPDLTEFIKDWFNSSSFKASSDFLFCTNTGTPLTIAAISQAIQKAAIKAKWPAIRKCNPHIFRHASVLELQKAGVAEHFIKQRFWNNPNTEMASKAYLHLNTNDTNNAIKKVYENKTQEPAGNDPFRQKTCFHCGKNWPFDKQICDCGIDLHNPNKIFSSQQELMARLSAMEEQQKMMQTAIKEIITNKTM